MNNGSVNQPTGNVVVDPDTVWNEDGSRKDPSEWKSVNPHNIAEDQYQGKAPKGRNKYGKIFDEEARVQIVEDEKVAQKLAEDTEEVDEEVAHLLADEDEDEQLGEELNLDDVGAVLNEIKILDAARKGGNDAADEMLLNILQAEYKRGDGGRQRVKGALSALGYKKPGKN